MDTLQTPMLQYVVALEDPYATVCGRITGSYTTVCLLHYNPHTTLRVSITIPMLHYVSALQSPCYIMLWHYMPLCWSTWWHYNPYATLRGSITTLWYSMLWRYTTIFAKVHGGITIPMLHYVSALQSPYYITWQHYKPYATVCCGITQPFLLEYIGALQSLCYINWQHYQPLCYSTLWHYMPLCWSAWGHYNPHATLRVTITIPMLHYMAALQSPCYITWQYYKPLCYSIEQSQSCSL